ncbi:Asp23/Gls24 family envelope stress response protein [bacterium]|nr:Asp23/Gls24 family envelope stress response protein [bacterium]MBU4362254.1 Asp23/Gls24 family envelope stress response protein [bacterium]MBU4603029.1 Asp23/Gls24 family envelope stress response protein [bacterium]MCG2762677.1 Asp23/Gls24 family envelope stress response protein [Candidatus Atribacteria bacterium]
MQTIKTDLGEINVSRETIGSIVSLNLADVKGVVGSRKSIIKEITDMLRGDTSENEREEASRTIKVEVKDNKPLINLYIIIKYGVRIPDIAWDIQNRVKEGLREKLGTDINEINIHVQGIQFPKKTQSRRDLVASNLFVKVF